MLDFNFCCKTYYEFGKDKEKNVSKLIRKFGGSRVLIHYGGSSSIKSGLISRIKSYLDEVGIFYLELGGVQTNPCSDLVYQGIDLCQKYHIDFILAIGGGSVIDSAKAIGAGLCYEGDFWDFFREENRKVVEKSMPVGVILTIAAAGSESSASMVITNSSTHSKRGNIKCDAVRPVFAIMNPELTYTVSLYQSACGIVDIMTHIMERYFSNTKNCRVTDGLCEGLLKAVIASGERVMKDPHDYEARANIMWASTIAHNNVLGVDREQDWASHKIEHELSGKYGVAHGAGLAVVVIKWMRYVSKRNPEKFRQFGKNVFGIRTDLFGTDDDYIEQGIQKLQEFWLSLGMPSSFYELGYQESDLEDLVNGIDYASDGTIGNYVKLTKEDISKIYHS